MYALTTEKPGPAGRHASPEAQVVTGSAPNPQLKSSMTSVGLDLAQHLSELPIHLADELVVHSVSDPLATRRSIAGRVGKQHPLLYELVDRVEGGGLRDVEGTCDFGASLVGKLAQVPDDARSHHVAESLNGILRVGTVRGAGVLGHPSIVPWRCGPRPQDCMN